MTRISLIAVAAVSVLLLGASVGYEKVTEKSEAERAIMVQQQAIQKYSEKVGEVDGLLKKFTDVWRKANELKDIKALKEAFDTRVIPALEEYVGALGKMPTESEALVRIHALVKDAYVATVDVFKKFADGLTEENLVERHKKLLEATDTVAKAEEQYYAQLSKYYADNKVTLSQDDRGKAPKAAEKKPTTPKK